MFNTPLFARTYLSIDRDRAHSHMRAWTTCIAGRGVQMVHPELDFSTLTAKGFGRALAGKYLGLYDATILIRETAMKAFGITGPTVLATLTPPALTPPAMLEAIERFIEHYYPRSDGPVPARGRAAAGSCTQFVYG